MPRNVAPLQYFGTAVGGWHCWNADPDYIHDNNAQECGPPAVLWDCSKQVAFTGNFCLGDNDNTGPCTLHGEEW
jgi:hypothetical protein